MQLFAALRVGTLMGANMVESGLIGTNNLKEYIKNIHYT